MGRTRTSTVVFAFFLLLPAGVGVLAAHAAPGLNDEAAAAAQRCARLVRTYITVPVRNRVSRATALAWAKWRIGHPNWKPNPRAHRPKYLMTTQEVMDKVAFACSVESATDAAHPFFAGLGQDQDQDKDALPTLADASAMGPGHITLPEPIWPQATEASSGTPTSGAPGTPGTPGAAGGPSGGSDAPAGELAGVLIGGFAGPFSGVPASYGSSSEGPASLDSASPILSLGPDVPIIPTPEPAPFALVALGIAAVWLMRRHTLVSTGTPSS